ncbi:hypothetical protein [Rickettsia endosymbiont of Cardiosporidium cionae]|uniref:hypothetical protein n=1 Tax=Rickettsia endosymbiont of Cardiosporidium cionae TaxID=2777155 RepID=UPI001893689C|nr:hypothetical protein [Rickettsia endosymbiont of Cardiosporidium cionae]KAF8818422.1 hypothetical protein IHI24_000512 [Rickettsia endosymbiont of Cardiosporidium cionae]
MQSNNYNINLMIPNRANKDVIFNEAISTIDNFLNIAIQGFISEIPKELPVDKKYILIKNDQSGYNNKIIYKIHEQQNIKLLSPKESMIVFVIENNSFFIFSNDQWHKIPNSYVNDNIYFHKISKEYNIDTEHNILYLYLEGHCDIVFSVLPKQPITLIIKQNTTYLYKISWSDNILWPIRQMHDIPDVLDSIKLVSFISLPTDNQVLAYNIQHYQNN